MTPSASVRLAEVLLVDDNPGHVRLMEEAFRENGIGERLALRVVRDGVEAMAYARHEGRYAESPRPDLILLDLNLPRKSGREVLAELKRDPDLKRIPIVVLTTSRAERDISMAYDLGANCYIHKSASLDLFFRAAQLIEDFWLRVATLPPR